MDCPSLYYMSGNVHSIQGMPLRYLHIIMVSPLLTIHPKDKKGIKSYLISLIAAQYGATDL